MKKESLLSSMPKLILAVVLIVCVGAVMGLMGYALTKPKIPNQLTPTQKEISAVEISADKKSIINAETKEIIFTVEEANEYLEQIGYKYNPETFQTTNTKYKGDYFLNAVLANNKRRIVFSTGCLQDDLPQVWTGIHRWGFTCQRFPSWQCDPNDPTAPGQEGFNQFEQSSYFLIAGSGRNFVWSSDDKTITYEADLGLSGTTEIRTIDSQTGDILERENKPTTKDWKTYGNEKYGFKFSYPGEWNIRDCSPAKDIFQTCIDMSNGSLAFFLLVQKTGSNSVPDGWITYSSAEVNVDEQKTNLYFIYQDRADEKVKNPEYFIPFEKNKMRFYIHFPQNSRYYVGSTQFDLIKKILSTFKFTEK